MFLCWSFAAWTAPWVGCAEAGGDVSLPVLADRLETKGLCDRIEKMQIHAHRGAGNRPENTLAAFREAVRQGADTIELDLQITRDREVVVTHDADLRANQCLDPKGMPQDPDKKAYVWHMTLAEVKRYDCGSLVQEGATPVPGERIVTLTEAMALLREHKGLRFNIEIKYQDPKFYPPLEEYVDAVIGAAEKAGVDPKRFFFQSFHHGALAILKRKRPGWEISPLVGGGEGGRRMLARVPYDLGAKLVTPHFSALDSEIVRKLHADGIRVIPWTVNAEEEMRSLIDKGVDGLITDRVGLFQKVKRELCSR